MVDLRLVPSRTGRPSAASRREVVQHGQVLLGRLAEADTRVDDQALPDDAGAEGAIERARQIGDHLGDDVR